MSGECYKRHLQRGSNGQESAAITFMAQYNNNQSACLANGGQWDPIAPVVLAPTTEHIVLPQAVQAGFAQAQRNLQISSILSLIVCVLFIVLIAVLVFKNLKS